jgi:hypothetical protein
VCGFKKDEANRTTKESHGDHIRKTERGRKRHREGQRDKAQSNTLIITTDINRRSTCNAKVL